MVELQPSKLVVRVRFPSPAPENSLLSSPASAVATRWLLCCRYSNPSELHGRLLALVSGDGLTRDQI